MSDDVPLTALSHSRQVQPHAVEIPAPSPVTEVPSPEKVQAVDAVFVHYDEQSSVTDLIGLYAGVMLLGDLARDEARAPGPDEPGLDDDHNQPVE